MDPTTPASATVTRSPDPDTVAAAAATFRTLADPTRLNILLLLARGERDVTGLRTALGLRQPSVSTHLALLRRAGLVAGRRAGKRVVYSLVEAPPPAATLEYRAGGLCLRLATGRPPPHGGQR